MRFEERISLFLKISLPFLIVILLEVSPVSSAVRKDLRLAQLAREGQAAQPAGSESAGSYASGGSAAAGSSTAADALQRVLAREPWRVDLWDAVGRADLAAGRVAEAIDALRKAERAGALSSAGRFQLGEAYLSQGDDRSAEQTWQAQMRVEGPSARVFERLVQIKRARRDYAGAVETLRAWRAFAPDDPQVAYLLGLNLSAVKPDEAAPLLVEASQKNIDYSPAVQILRRGLAQADSAPDPAYGWLMIGRALGSIGQWDLAAEAFQRAVDASPKYAEAWGFLGEAKYHLNGSGKTELEKAGALSPTSPVVQALLALYWQRAGQYDKALVYLKAIAQQEPSEPNWQVEIGNTLALSGDINAAREYYQNAVDLAPNISLYWQYLARFSAENYVDIRSLGLPAARQAVLLAPDDPAALDAMGCTLLALGDTASAERFLQRALQKDATFAQADLHIGQLYLAQQDGDRAYLYLKRASSLAGENPVGATARRLLQQYYGESG